MSLLTKYLAPLILVGLAALSGPALAKPGCVGKMWNPITDIDYTLMGALKVAGISFLKSAKDLGEPPNHKVPSVCFCKDGLQSGFGIGLTFWLPTYVVDVARQAGCIGFLNGTNILPMFISLSSSQESTIHKQKQEGATNMQIHKARADITAIASKGLFEKCKVVSNGFSVDYLTEIDFVFQNDIYSAILSPQVALVASVPLLSTMACGFESMANTLGDWRDMGVCGWKGTRLPLSANSISKDSAQVTNMDVMLKFMTRSALVGSTLRTMGSDAVCGPQSSPLYDPFQHRYQWSFPAKVSARYNVDVVRWGLFNRGSSGQSLASAQNEINSISLIAKSDASAAPASGDVLARAALILSSLPKPLNYPTREAGYMHIWEARQCCIMVVTVQNVLETFLQGQIPAAGPIRELYEAYNTAQSIYKIIQDPIGAAMGYIGGQITDALGSGFTQVTGALGFGGSGSAGVGGSVTDSITKSTSGMYDGVRQSNMT